MIKQPPVHFHDYVIIHLFYSIRTIIINIQYSETIIAIGPDGKIILYSNDYDH